MKKRYDVIYSIGRDCSTSMYLNKFNIRIVSGPFDWLTNVNEFSKRIEIILSNFENFLNFEDIKLLTKSCDKTQNYSTDDYYNERLKFHYYHDFPAGISLEESYPRVKEKYDRRIKRFLENLKSNKKVLLVWFSHFPTATDNEKVVSLCNQVCKKFNKQIDFLIIEHDETKKSDEISKTVLTDNIIKYNLYTHASDENGNPTTMGKIETCSKIFSNYKLKKSFKDVFKIFIKNIFSVKNEYSGNIKRKVLTILGIKFKVGKTTKS